MAQFASCSDLSAVDTKVNNLQIQVNNLGSGSTEVADQTSITGVGTAADPFKVSDTWLNNQVKAKETTTTITNTLTDGTKIGTFTNEDGTVVDIYAPEIPPFKTCYKIGETAPVTRTTFGAYLSKAAGQTRYIREFKIIQSTPYQVIQTFTFANPILYWDGANYASAQSIYDQVQASGYFDAVSTTLGCPTLTHAVYIANNGNTINVAAYEKNSACNAPILAYYVAVKTSQTPTGPLADDYDSLSGTYAWTDTFNGTPFEVVHANGVSKIFENGVVVTDATRLAQLQAVVDAGSNDSIICCPSCTSETSGGGGTDNDNQQLSLAGNQLSISGGNTVDLSNVGATTTEISYRLMVPGAWSPAPASNTICPLTRLSQTRGSAIQTAANNTFLLKAGFVYVLEAALQGSFNYTDGHFQFAWYSGASPTTINTKVGTSGRVYSYATTFGNGAFGAPCKAFIAPTTDVYVALYCETNSGCTAVNAYGDATYASIQVIGKA